MFYRRLVKFIVVCKGTAFPESKFLVIHLFPATADFYHVWIVSSSKIPVDNVRSGLGNAQVADILVLE